MAQGRVNGALYPFHSRKKTLKLYSVEKLILFHILFVMEQLEKSKKSMVISIPNKIRFDSNVLREIIKSGYHCFRRKSGLYCLRRRLLGVYLYMDDIVVLDEINFDSMREGHRGVMAKALDCCLEVSEFELQSCYYVYFRTNILEESNKPSYISSCLVKLCHCH